jgi:hypothetical protein
MKTARYLAANGLALAISVGAYVSFESVGVRQSAPTVAMSCDPLAALNRWVEAALAQT